MRGSLVVAAVLLHSGLSLGDQALLAALKACNTISHQVSNSTGVYYLGAFPSPMSRVSEACPTHALHKALSITFPTSATG